MHSLTWGLRTAHKEAVMPDSNFGLTEHVRLGIPSFENIELNDIPGVASFAHDSAGLRRMRPALQSENIVVHVIAQRGSNTQNIAEHAHMLELLRKVNDAQASLMNVPLWPKGQSQFKEQNETEGSFNLPAMNAVVALISC